MFTLDSTKIFSKTSRISGYGTRNGQAILATLGPSSLNVETIEGMDQCGVDLFRLNLSHVPLNQVEENIKLIMKTTKVPLCIDTEGAQIRNQTMKNGHTFFQKNSMVKIHFNEVVGDEENISYYPDGIAKSFEVGDIIKIDFDMVTMTVIEKNRNHAVAQVLQSGLVSSNKASNLNRNIDLPAITDKDMKAIAIAKELGIKHFALSFASSRKDVDKIRNISGDDSFIISKIENRNGLKNINQILNASDASLIDRGDLSREVSLSTIPLLQRRIISLAKLHSVPIYVATNLLEYMILNRQPTRAEVNDVVSTILMGADGLVLAAETAIGKYPVLAVNMINHLLSICHRWTPNTSIEEILEIADDYI